MTYDEFKKQGEARGCECFLTQLDDPEGQRLTQTQAFIRRQRQRRQIIQWLEDLPKPLGLLVYNEYMAARICAWCQQEGLSVPEEIAILGYGNKRFVCRALPVSLSSIEPNEVEYGRQAVCLLKQLIDGDPPPAAPVMIPPKGFVERQSTNILAIPDPVAARALHFIWKHFSEPLSVDEIAAEVAVCRRTLERGFRKHLNRSVNAELQRKRLEQCCKLLKTTDYTLAEIAPQVGFSSANYLQIAFKKAFGITPRKYRL